MSANLPLTRLFTLAALLSACATSPAPKAFRLSTKEVQVTAVGAWTRVVWKTHATDGEMLSANLQEVVLKRKGEVARIPWKCVDDMVVVAYEADTGPVTMVGTLGSVSTLSHGFFLVASFPIWILTSSVSNSLQSGSGTLHFKRKGSDELDPGPIHLWARFPQGMPAEYLPSVPVVRTIERDCGPLGDRPTPPPHGGTS